MSLNPKKVLLIRNSNAAQSALSQSVSDWYATARGLTETGPNDYFWMSFDFGDGTQRLATRLAADYNAFDTPNVLNPYLGNGTGSFNLGVSTASVKVLDSTTTPVTCVAHSSKISGSRIGQMIFTAIGLVITQYEIDAVFVLPGVPQSLFGPYFNQGIPPPGQQRYYYGQHVETALAYSASWMNTTAYTRIVSNKSTSGSLPQFVTNGTASGAERRPGFPLTTTLNLAGFGYSSPIAYGRVGWVEIEGTAFSTLSQVQTIVNNAIAAEAESNLGKLHIMGGTAYITRTGGVLESTAINYAARDFGVTNLGYIQETFYYDPPSGSGLNGIKLDTNPVPDPVQSGWTVRSYSAGIGYAEEELWPVRPALAGNPLAVFSGNASNSLSRPDGGNISTFAVASPKLAVDNVNNKWFFEPGGWVYSWTSTAGFMSLHCLKNGGSLGFGCAGEPYNINIVQTSNLVNLLFLGYCGAEASFRADENFRYTGPSVRDLANNQQWSFTPCYISAHGDPLYAPYKTTSQKLMQVGA